MAEEEEKSFVIRDRRGRTEAERSSAAEPSAKQPSATQPDTQEPPRESSSQAQPGPGAEAPVTFSGFIFSLGSSALMLMGESIDPRHPNPPVNLPQAKEIIDILSVMESKTQGNLTDDERAVLTDMLYTLRMKYVDMASGKKPSPQS